MAVRDLHDPVVVLGWASILCGLVGAILSLAGSASGGAAILGVLMVYSGVFALQRHREPASRRSAPLAAVALLIYVGYVVLLMTD